MNNRLWLNVSLLLVVAFLAYFIAYSPSFFQQNKTSSSSNLRLFTIAPYQVEHIQIQRKGKPDIVFNKVDGQWQLLKPGVAAVNSEKIKHLLTLIDEPVIAHYDLSGKDLKPYGLSPGKIQLTINKQKLIFGSTNAVTLNRYVLKNGQVYTINEIVYGVLGGSVVNFLTHHLLPEKLSVQSVSAPSLFSNIDQSFWADIEARDIADYKEQETIIGKVDLDVSGAESGKTTIHLDILSVEPVLVLGRPDLKVKYTFDKDILESYSK